MSKIQELKDKHPEFMIDLIGDLSQRDPSGTNKYLPFMVKVSADAVKEYFASKNYLDDTFIQLITLVKDFDKYCKLNLITNKDIYSYAEIKEIESVVKTAKEQNTTREVKDGQTIVLYEDKEKMLVKCLTRESAILYGKNTRWCTSAIKDNRFSSYASEGVLLYFIHKPSNSYVPAAWRKIGFNLKNINDTRIIWNAKSEQVGTFDAMLLFSYVGKEIMDIVNKEFELCIPNSFLTKDDDGKIMIRQKLFDKPYWKDRQNTILTYIDDLKDVRLKNAKAELTTYDPTSEIEREEPEEIGLEEVLQNINNIEVAPPINQDTNTIIERMALNEAIRRSPVLDIDPQEINFNEMIANEARSNVSFEQALQAHADRDNGMVSMMSGISSLMSEVKMMAAPAEDYGISELKAMAAASELKAMAADSDLASDDYCTVSESEN